MELAMIIRAEHFAEVIEDSNARRAWWTEILALEQPEEVEIEYHQLVGATN